MYYIYKRRNFKKQILKIIADKKTLIHNHKTTVILKILDKQVY